MSSLFTRLYVQFTATLLVIITSVAVGLYFYGRIALERYALERITPVAQLAADGWLEMNEDERANWLVLVSNLSGTQWHKQELALPTAVKVENIFLQAARVDVFLRLDDTRAARIEIDDWPEWEKAYGWLFLDAISDVPSELREAKFQSLRAQVPWPIERVNRNTEPLSALGLRQLNNGQSLRVTSGMVETKMLYYPAGASQVIRMGPIPTFELLTNFQWFGLSAISLFLLGVGFVFWVRPVQLRFAELIGSVEAINEQQSSVKLPTEYRDDLGRLSRRIDGMARSLILQLQQNKQLNQAVSHDLKTPLARIKFSLALLPVEPTNDYVQQIQNDVDLLTQLTQELLLYHQLTDETVNKNVHCDAIAVLNKTIAQLPNDIKVTHNFEGQSITAPMHESHWRRLCDNLCNNAVQYGKGQVHIQLTESASQLLLYVEDDGLGIEIDKFEQLKQPFQRLSKHRDLQQNNHGLGLALVDATVRHYQGTWWLENSALGGARFVIEVPKYTYKTYNSITK